jgi:tripartite-type tricarboxylate transporter receptor subunit TctC
VKNTKPTEQKLRRSVLLAATLSLALPVISHAQSSHRIVVGFAPGGTLDVLGRAIAQALQEETGQTFIVENQPGASSLVAAQAVARARPDGHSILLAPVVVPAFMPHLYKSLNFDPIKDLTPVAELGTFSFALVTGSQSSIQSLSDWTAYAKAHPQKVSLASFGSGTPSHFMGSILNQATGTQALHVAYKGGAPALTAVLSGEVTGGFLLTGGSTAEQLKAGKIRVLGVSGEQRSAALPEVPTFSEQGIAAKDMQNASLWYGFFTSSKVAPQQVNLLNAQLQKALRSPKVQAVMATEDIHPSKLSATEFQQKVQRDHKYWGDVIKATGFTLD